MRTATSPKEPFAAGQSAFLDDALKSFRAKFSNELTALRIVAEIEPCADDVIA